MLQLAVVMPLQWLCSTYYWPSYQYFFMCPQRKYNVSIYVINWQGQYLSFLLPQIGNTIILFYTYANVTSKGKHNRPQLLNHEINTKKNQKGTSNINSLDEESELIKRKLEAEKARKRTRGPYRKSHVN